MRCSCEYNVCLGTCFGSQRLMSFTVMLTLEWQVCPDCCGLCPICRLPKCGRWYVHFGVNLLIWQHLGATCHLSRAETPFPLQKCLVPQVKCHVSAMEVSFCSVYFSHFSFLDPKRAALTPKICVANRTGRSNARITVARLRFEWGVLPSSLVRRGDSTNVAIYLYL